MEKSDYVKTLVVGSKFGINATKKIAGGGFQTRMAPLIKMDEAVKAKVEKFQFLGSEI